MRKRDRGQAKEKKKRVNKQCQIEKAASKGKNRGLSGSAQRLQTRKRKILQLSSSVQLAPSCHKHEGIGKIADKATRL